ncbi:MAG: hypothetical protein LBF74_12385 [Treponema sp.]|nr:hypothetical protein [Treponema sp.]
MDTPQTSASTPENIQWHSAFFQAIQAELIDYKDILEFKQEHPLTTEPLRIDTIIIVKPSDVTIDKNIARIFKKINILEYKSPQDYLSIKDFYKAYAYVALFAALTADVEMGDMTLTFVGNTYPRKLIRYLKEVRHYRVEEVESGIHYVKGDYLPIQILETKKLGTNKDGGSSANWVLKYLNRGLEREEMSRILKKSKELIEAAPLDAYLYALIQANLKAFEEVTKMTKDRMTVEDVLMRTGILPKWIRLGREEVARNLLKKGWTIEETAEVAELDIGKIRALSASL